MKIQKRSNQFKSDVKLVARRGKDISKLEPVLSFLIDGKPLPLNYKDHPLKGSYTGRRECHIEPDWLLIYKSENDIVIFERTGRHSDLFEKKNR